MCTGDIKNAFNSAYWLSIVDKLHRRNVPAVLRRIVMNYLSERTINYLQDKSMDMTRGVPQGSVLGPLLWNICYDGVLELEMPTGVMMVCYADDLAVVASARNAANLETVVAEAISRISTWMEGRK